MPKKDWTTDMKTGRAGLARLPAIDISKGNTEARPPWCAGVIRGNNNDNNKQRSKEAIKTKVHRCHHPLHLSFVNPPVWVWTPGWSGTCCMVPVEGGKVVRIQGADHS